MRALLLLENTKKATRTGRPEQVMISDPLTLAALSWAGEDIQQDTPYYEYAPKQFNEDIKWLAGLFGITGPDLTAYVLRRGGATWHFMRYGSLDATAALGRWEQNKTAKIYIQSAVADVVKWSLSPDDKSRVKLAKKVLIKVLKERAA